MQKESARDAAGAANYNPLMRRIRGLMPVCPWAENCIIMYGSANQEITKELADSIIGGLAMFYADDSKPFKDKYHHLQQL